MSTHLTNPHLDFGPVPLHSGGISILNQRAERVDFFQGQKRRAPSRDLRRSFRNLTDGNGDIFSGGVSK
jgi:hypothetical protein